MVSNACYMGRLECENLDDFLIEPYLFFFVNKVSIERYYEVLINNLFKDDELIINTYYFIHLISSQ